MCDKTGKSILHLLNCKLRSYQEGINLLRFKEIYVLRNRQDHQRNTALHLAVKNMEIQMVRVLLESSVKLSIKNMEGLLVASFTQQQKLLEVLPELINSTQLLVTSIVLLAMYEFMTIEYIII